MATVDCPTAIDAGDFANTSAGGGTLQYAQGQYVEVGIDYSAKTPVAENWRIQFNLSGVPGGVTLSAATVIITVDTTSWSVTPDGFNCYRITGAWSEVNGGGNATAYDNGTSWGTVPHFTGSTSAQYSFALSTTLVANWLSGAWSNYGFVAELADSTNSGGAERANIYAQDNLTPSNRPILRITYETPPTTPGAFTNPTGGTVSGVISVAWGASTDAESDTITYFLERWDGGAWQALTNGTATSYSWDTRTVPNLVSAQLRVRAIDLAGSNTYSSYQTSATFNILNAGMILSPRNRRADMRAMLGR